MQIYVDEIPKNCDECKFQVFVAHNQHGWRRHERYCSIMKDNYDCKCSKEHCPLKSLGEHDKQVRKEVAENLKQEIIYYPVGLLDIDKNPQIKTLGISKEILESYFEKILDQI